MSKRTICVYSNLPSGGAKRTYESTVNHLKRNNKVIIIKEPKYKVDNIFSYLYTALVTSRKNQKYLAAKNESQRLLCYQSWITNSPYILRYFHYKSVYICHEVPRVFYDEYVIQTMTIKEKIINIIRLPIKYIDYLNVKTSNLTIVANSLFSKKIIDKAYGVDSLVVYPGINVSDYQKDVKIAKKNQVITLGAINRLKNQKFLVDVISEIPEEKRPELVCINNGSDQKYSKSLISYSKKTNVKIKIMENISERRKIQELKKSMCFMYAPINEPFGIVVEEAISAGLPIQVYAKGGGYSEVICDKNGLLMNDLNPKVWAREYLNLFKNNRRLQSINSYNYSYARSNFEEVNMNNKIEKILFSGTL